MDQDRIVLVCRQYLRHGSCWRRSLLSGSHSCLLQESASFPSLSIGNIWMTISVVRCTRTYHLCKKIPRASWTGNDHTVNVGYVGTLRQDSYESSHSRKTVSSRSPKDDPQFTRTGNAPVLKETSRALRSAAGVFEYMYRASMPNDRKLFVN